MSDSACCKELCNETDDEFDAVVETIMKCNEFKSNFARQLSNRYDVNLPEPDKNDDEIQKNPTESNVPDSPEKSADLPVADDVKDTCPVDDDSTVVPQKSAEINTSINKTEVTDLNRKVATLNWQLNQVETNRQIHTSLLKQIVIFLNRVKDHLEIEIVKDDTEEPVSASGDLPRSCSVVHVYRNPEFTLPAKKSASKKLSTSISNVNRFKEYTNWDSSKTFVNIDTNTDKKIIEEMKRLIILATTLLNTKIPNLASQFGNAANVVEKEIPKIEVTISEPSVNVNDELHLQKSNKTESLAVATDAIRNIGQSRARWNDGAVASCSRSSNFLAPPHPLLFGRQMTSFNLLPIEKKIEYSNMDKLWNEAVNENNNVEDESGFSSLNSIHEIGIPVIEFQPATPPEEEEEAEELPTTNGYGPHEPENDPPKVFWV